MNLKAGLFQQQSLKLTMTQELSQAIALLQYSTQELISFLEEKATENPLIKLETEYVPIMESGKSRKKGKRKSFERSNDAWIEQIGFEQKNLDAYLYSQLNLDKLDMKDKQIIDEIIYHLDENGYLCIDLAEIAQVTKAPLEKVQTCLSMIQGLEPAGVGARDLRECLYLQLVHLEKRDELAEKIVYDYFPLFADKKWKELSKQLNIPIKTIQEVYDFVQTLNPRPAAEFQNESAVYIIPDVVVEIDGESFSIKIFDEALPKVSFNEAYFERFSVYQDKQVKRFLNEKQQDYLWVVRSLEQRKETLKNVTLKIVEKQQDFFRKGPSYLKPMVMRDIAEELNIHESTVSRAVREKYVQTPFGLYELKWFFTSTIQTLSTENASSQQVKEWISQLVDKEDKSKPLSDQQMVEILEKEQGIVVSRRTIAKYREQLKIPSSSKRKRYD